MGCNGIYQLQRAQTHLLIVFSDTSFFPDCILPWERSFKGSSLWLHSSLVNLFHLFHLQVFHVWWDGRWKIDDSHIFYSCISSLLIISENVLNWRRSFTFYFQLVMGTQIRLMFVCTFESHMHEVLWMMHCEYTCE